MRGTRVLKPAPKYVKPFVGFIFRDVKWLKRALKGLNAVLGTVDFESPILDFDATDYYKDEFGEGLKRKFVSFRRLRRLEEIGRIKIKTNHLETALTNRSKRRVNIDPGYLELSKVVLLTTKDYFHRIYLAKGIYAEVTLFYKDKTFNAFPWTYPDYRTKEYIGLFNQMRQIYKDDLTTMGNA